MNAFTREQVAYMEMIIEGTRSDLLNSALTACAPSGAPIVSLVNKVDIACPGDVSGSIQLTATSGTAPYTYSLDGGATQGDGNFTNISAGDHTILVTESEGITSQYSFTITEPPAQEFDIEILSDACIGSTNGSASILSTGGNESFKSLRVFNTQFDETQSFFLSENFINGIPNTWVADNDWLWGNSEDLSSQFFPIPESQNCVALNDDGLGEGVVGNGSLISPNVDLGGNSAFTVNFDAYYLNGNFEGFQESAKLFFSPDDGVTWEEIADLQGADEWITYSIDITAYSSSTIKIRLDYNDGGGWNYGLAINQVSVLPLTSGIFNNLAAGIYDVIFTDAQDCQYNTSFEILESDPISIGTVTTVNPNCGGLGSIGVMATSTNGISQYEINGITNGTGFFDISGPGNYTIAVTDNEGCMKETMATLVNEGGISLSANSVSAVSCACGQDGSFTVDISGAQGTMVMSLNGSAVSSSNFENLSAGIYEFSVSDDGGCNSNLSITIEEPTPITVTGDVIAATCLSMGQINFNTTGGVPPYSYSYESGVFSTTDVLTNLPSGTYEILCRDATGCEASAIFAIGSNNSTTEIEETLVSCSIDEYIVQLCTSDGLTADWSVFDNAGNQIIEAGNGACVDINMSPFLIGSTEDYFYAIEAITSDGCVSELNTVAFQPETFDPVIIDVPCEGTISFPVPNSNEFQSIQVENQDGDMISATDDTFILEPGNTYTITTIDLNGCINVLSLTNIINDPVSINIGSTTDATGGTGGSVELEGSGGLAPYSFTIEGETNSTGIFTNLDPGEYVATIEDASGCQSEISFVIQMQSAVDELILSSQIELYPNPAVDKLVVSLGNNKRIEELWIYSIHGQRLQHLHFSTSEAMLNIENLESGIYLLSVRSGEELGVRRFVKF